MLPRFHPNLISCGQCDQELRNCIIQCIKFNYCRIPGQILSVNCGKRQEWNPGQSLLLDFLLSNEATFAYYERRSGTTLKINSFLSKLIWISLLQHSLIDNGGFWKFQWLCALLKKSFQVPQACSDDSVVGWQPVLHLQWPNPAAYDIWWVFELGLHSLPSAKVLLCALYAG